MKAQEYLEFTPEVEQTYVNLAVYKGYADQVIYDHRNKKITA
jgi:hypothetical protein